MLFDPGDIRATHLLRRDSVEIICCGKPKDWRTGGKNFDHIVPLAKHHGVNEVKVIFPEHGIRVIGSTESLQQVEVCGILFHVGKMDGVCIQPGQAAFIASADCPTITCWHSDREDIWVLHGSRECLIDRASISLNGNSARNHQSIIDALLGREDVKNLPRCCFHVFSVLGIGPMPHPESHAEHGLFNGQLLESLRKLDASCVQDESILLHEVTRHQFRLRGVTDDFINHDCVDTSRTCWGYENRVFWSANHGEDERNGVLVINRGRN